MFEAIRDFGQIGAVLLIGLATGASWMMVIVAPNVSYDRLDKGRADTHIRDLLKNGSDQIAILLIAGAALAILGEAIGAGITAAIAAFGFFSNRWTLASFKKGDIPAGTKSNRQGQRVMAVSLTLLFTIAAAMAAGMAVFGI